MKGGLLLFLLPPLALLFVAGSGKAQPAKLTQGKAYRAVFTVPPTLENHMADVARVMPAGSDLVLDGSKLQVRFIAPTSGTIGDVVTPFGSLKLTTLEELG